MKQLKLIAVDLTPVLPGGENGGAKVFTLALINSLAEMLPETQFILLTSPKAYDELTSLERKNIKLKVITNTPIKSSLQLRMRTYAGRLLAYTPKRLQPGLGYLMVKTNAWLKRSVSKTLLKKMKADLLFCPFTAPIYDEDGIPTVCTIYDLQYKTHPDFFEPADVAQRDNTFKEACKRATYLAAISEYSRASAIQHGNINPNKIKTIYIRMAQRMIEKKDGNLECLTQFNLKPQRFLVYPANFWKHKNHEMLITAFGIACQQGLDEDVKLICTGANLDRLEWLMQAVKGMKLSDRIIFPGYLPNESLSSLVEHSGGVVFPSLYEGFGMPIIEAMAMGIPVACSNCTSLPEVAGDAAILFDPRIPTEIAAAMISLLNDKNLRDRLILKGKSQAKPFYDISLMASEYKNLFEQALAAPIEERRT